MIGIALVTPAEATKAFAWHKNFAEAHVAIYPREEEQFYQFIEDRWVWAAKGDSGKFVGMVYAAFDDEHRQWELGGLMVAENYRKDRGLGTLLMRVALGHTLFEQDPLHAEPPEQLIAHVLYGNDAPRKIIQEQLGFKHAQAVSIHGSLLKGLPTCDQGFVHGDEFILDVPRGLELLARWADTWNGELRNGEGAEIRFRYGVGIAKWAAAFGEWATELGADA
jgi:hypothetical protein